MEENNVPVETTPEVCPTEGSSCAPTPEEAPAV